MPTDSASTLAVQVLATSTGALLLTAVLLLWRRSLTGAAGLLAAQGAALAALALVMSTEAAAAAPLALLLVLVKAVLIPWLILRCARDLDGGTETGPLVNPTSGMLLSAVLVTAAFLVGRPLTVADRPDAVPGGAVPVGIALVLIGFLVLSTRRQAFGQTIGFVMVDNGIAATAFLSSGGLPLIIELGVLFDVVLVVVILTMLTRRMHALFGVTEVHDLNELRD